MRHRVPDFNCEFPSADEFRQVIKDDLEIFSRVIAAAR